MKKILLPLCALVLAGCQEATTIDTDCQGLGDCQVTLPSGESVTLALEGEAKAMTPLTLAISSNHDIDDASVVFTGIDMDMGRLPFELTDTPTGVSGVGRVARCMEPTMNWQASYEFSLNGERYQVLRELEVSQ